VSVARTHRNLGGSIRIEVLQLLKSWFLDVLIDYMAASGTVDVEPVRMIFPSADLGAFLGEDIAEAPAPITIP